MVDLSKIRPGDGVIVRLEWAGSANNRLWVKPYGAHDSDAVPISAGDIVSYTPKPLAVGDRVKSAGDSCHLRLAGEIVYVHADRAWVRWDPLASLGPGDEGSNALWRLKNLERADA